MKRLLALLLAGACGLGMLGCADAKHKTEGTATELAAPQVTTMAHYPNEDDYYRDGDWDSAAWETDYAAWKADHAMRTENLQSIQGRETYFRTALSALLSGDEGENRVCSPVNVYLALAMLVEVTDGTTRDEILAALGAADIEALRTSASAIWLENDWDDGRVTSRLANSFWLKDGEEYHTAVLDRLAQTYHAAAFSGEMGTDAYTQALRNWLNENTGDLLHEQTEGLTLSKDTVLALASTVYFKAAWQDKFYKGATVDDTFHTPDGELTCAFMQSAENGRVYDGAQFSALRLNLLGSGAMWLVLPKQGVTPETLLEDEQTLTFLTSNGDWASYREGEVQLRLPKFDVSSNLDLEQSLRALGISDVFAPGADFSPLTQTPLLLSKAEHAARVMIDEDGCTAAAYTVLAVEATEERPQQEIIELTFDRPFLFTITGLDGLPLFAGVVNRPTE